jgi:tetratricopeptide (TPR) repeat protein
LKALKSHPRFVLALRGLALTFKETGRISKAISTTEKAIGFAPQVPQLYFDLGELYMLFPDYEKALDAYEKVRDLAPGSPLSEKAEKKISKLKIK